MASLTCVDVTSFRSRDGLHLSFASCRRSDNFVKVTASVSPRMGERGRLREGFCVKAMAVAKFKGTQMREKHLTEMIEKTVIEAKEVCEGNKESDECKVAWDEVEEVSQAKADLRRKMEKEDPLESFCNDNPETDECRIYDD